MKSLLSSAAASQPDIEDLIILEASDTTADNATPFLMQHDASMHNFAPQELQTTRMELLAWYDAHRRKLPWRGDLPPYLTTAMHTSQKKKHQAAAMIKGLDAFFEKEEVVDVNSGKVEEQVVPDTATEPRKVEPYETWVSEIMLQQTRVDTVVEFFLRWMDKFPTIAALAVANKDDVNASWAGLGYYRRARMLHTGAKYVVENYEGKLPSTVEELLTIPGIGPYTAGAIASIAFNNREPLVDGNVIRVLARMRAVGADPKNKQLIKFSWKVAKELVIECDRPGALNQALMELGAIMCTVQNPQCSSCPVKSRCLAYEKANTVGRKNDSLTTESSATSLYSCSICDYTRATEWDEAHAEVITYPLKAKKNESKNEVIIVAVISTPVDSQCEKVLSRKLCKVSTSDKVGNTVFNWRYLMSKRPEGGLLAGQWEFFHKKVDAGDKIPPYTKRKSSMDARLIETFGKSALTRSGTSIPERRDLGKLTHIFSHVKHHMGIEHVHFPFKPELLATESPGLRWMTLAEMNQLGITTGVKKILDLVLHPASKTRTSQVMSKASTHSTVSHRASKRLKPIAAFFKPSS